MQPTSPEANPKRRVEDLKRECHKSITPSDIKHNPDHNVNADTCECSQCEDVRAEFMKATERIVMHIGGALEVFLSALETLTEVHAILQAAFEARDDGFLPTIFEDVTGVALLDPENRDELVTVIAKTSAVATGIEEATRPDSTQYGHDDARRLRQFAVAMTAAEDTLRICTDLFIAAEHQGVTVTAEGVKVDVEEGDGLLDLLEKRVVVALCEASYARVATVSTQYQVAEIETESDHLREQFDALIDSVFGDNGDSK